MPLSPPHPTQLVILGYRQGCVGQCLTTSSLQETQVQFLGQTDPLEKEMATHSSVLAWKIPWIEEPGRLQSMELQASDMTE